MYLKHLPLFLKPIVTTSQRSCKSLKRDVLPQQMAYVRGSYIFNKQTQQPDELLDHYITDIMKQAELCKYGTLKDAGTNPK